MSASPFHAGELRVQERLGVREQIEPWARRVVRGFLPEEHRAFYAQQPFLVAAARDDEERPWVTLLFGEPGFAHSPTPETLDINTATAAGDALEGAFRPGSEVGLLGIELATRRRNRVNGQVSNSTAGAFTLAVGQSFGNCPQHIRPREWSRAPLAQARPDRTEFDHLPAALAEQVARADTFFIASGHRGAEPHEANGMDASHRGGPPGFVTVENPKTLSFPDYAGNNHFNTIGNLVEDPRAGLLFVDFARGTLLQLTGTVEIDWDSPAVAASAGAQRRVRFHLERVISLEKALPLRWSTPRTNALSLRLVERTQESADVVSFSFEAHGGAALPAWRPGQHLPIHVPLGDGTKETRTYSLSGAAGTNRYRISVKREKHGRVSQWLHEHAQLGSDFDADAPAGDFVLNDADRPVLLWSTGIGVTPMMAMLHATAAEPGARHVSFLHGARDGAHHALAEEVRALASAAPHVRVHIAYSQPRAEDSGYDATGRIGRSTIEHLVPDTNVDAYLCGPVAFLREGVETLEALGVPPDQIHFESFGPVG